MGSLPHKALIPLPQGEKGLTPPKLTGKSVKDPFSGSILVWEVDSEPGHERDEPISSQCASPKLAVLLLLERI